MGGLAATSNMSAAAGLSVALVGSGNMGRLVVNIWLVRTEPRKNLLKGLNSVRKQGHLELHILSWVMLLLS